MIELILRIEECTPRRINVQLRGGGDATPEEAQMADKLRAVIDAEIMKQSQEPDVQRVVRTQRDKPT